jgi:glycosyltransferase involved in cell wall biosynthesis
LIHDGDWLKKNKIFSVIIRVRNAEKDLRNCLQLLRQQLLPRDVVLEIVVVDNESADNSVLVAKEYGARVVFLPVAEFTWGRALNRGIAASTGEIVLLLSADAHPANSSWIIEMANSLNEPNVAAVYGRQIPRADAPIDEIVRLRKYFPPRSVIFNRHSLECGEEDIIASNACAAFHKRIWEAYPFDENVYGAEERIWIQYILTSGDQIRYCSSAIVFHSHKDTLFRNAFRLIELWEEMSSQNCKTYNAICFGKSILSYSKKRLINILSPEIAIRKRFESIIRLPFELTAMIIVFIAHQAGVYRKFRCLAWK